MRSGTGGAGGEGRGALSDEAQAAMSPQAARNRPDFIMLITGLSRLLMGRKGWRGYLNTRPLTCPNRTWRRHQPGNILYRYPVYIREKALQVEVIES